MYIHEQKQNLNLQQPLKCLKQIIYNKKPCDNNGSGNDGDKLKITTEKINFF